MCFTQWFRKQIGPYSCVIDLNNYNKSIYFSNLTLHRHPAPLRTDFTDTRTALRLFSLLHFFLVFSYRYFLPF